MMWGGWVGGGPPDPSDRPPDRPKIQYWIYYTRKFNIGYIILEKLNIGYTKSQKLNIGYTTLEKLNIRNTVLEKFNIGNASITFRKCS